MAAQVSVVLSSWYQYFTDAKVSPKEFYESVENIIQQRKLPDVTTSRISYAEGGLFSARREYLRVSYRLYVFDICAAPYGKDGFFISWWLGETTGLLVQLLSRVPVIGSFLAKNSKSKTYYQTDTENMFKESVRSSVMEAIDSISKVKGLRNSRDLVQQ